MSEGSSNVSFDLAGKTVVVTGSSTGIGKAIALEIAAAGASTILHGRLMSKELDGVYNEITQPGRNAFAIACDFTETTSMKSFVERCWNCTGRIDCWINCAGADVLTGDPAKLSFVEKLELLWKVDVRSSLILSRLVASKMRHEANSPPGSFSIINFGWDQARQGMEGDSGELFATVKGAIMAATQSLAQSYAPQVRVNCVAPGWIKTEWGETASDQWQYRATKQSLMNRWGTPEDVAAAAVWLASPAASFVSGQVVCVNGGFRYWN